jgi:hypothetical protein
MAHYAKVNQFNLVENVIVADQDFINNLPDKNMWIQTSYNTRGNRHYDPITGIDNTSEATPALRGNYACIGSTYDKTNDVFINIKPYLSWILNTNTWLWEPPINIPTTPLSNNEYYVWNESIKNWELQE